MSKDIVLKFDSGQDFQLKAINSVIKLFEGQPIDKGASSSVLQSDTVGIGMVFEEGVISNSLVEGVPVLNNLNKIQEENNIEPSELLDSCEVEVQTEGYENSEIISCGLNFSVEMETGTGKTYTYIRTCYELNKVYGFKKFVIVVPSKPIREGVMQSLNDTHKHFQLLYSNVPINYTLFDSSKKTQLQQFARSNSIEILVINIDSFINETNRINKVNEYGQKAITYIQKTNPILIIDEPQNMETDKRKSAIINLNPLCTLRYSATHKNYYNLIYSLNPVQAYDLGLVKQIEVDAVETEDDDFNNAFIKFKSIKRNTRTAKVKLTLLVNDKNSVKKKDIDIGVGQDLYELSSKRDMYYNGFILEEIDLENETISFTNGIRMELGQEQGGMNDEIQRFQIERTLIAHFEKERKLKNKGIKVLTLFFIDRVANYRTKEGEKGKFAIWFEEMFNDLAKRHYSEEGYPFGVEEVHNGYFAQDKNGFKDSSGETKADDEVYELIMKDKKRLLNEEEPLRFLFSHSALREGWDNPNVFQICTLNETKSDIKKRQEIGRGMRLPVNKNGIRSFDKNINILTIIANESYKDFSSALQKEILEETSVSFEGRIKNKREKTLLTLNKQLNIDNYPEFFELWEKIKYQTKYRVEYKTEDLINNSVRAIKENLPKTSRPSLTFAKNKLKYTNDGVAGDLRQMGTKRLDKLVYSIPNVFAFIQSKIDISKSTIAQILKSSEKMGEIFINPQMFLDNIVLLIKGELNKLLIDGIKYEKINNKEYAMMLIEDEEMERYLSNLKEVDKEKTDKTIYNYIEVDSDVEKDFIDECQYNIRVKFFFKLPKKGFHIPTPIGKYYPDWAVVLEDGIKVYFIAETKSSLNENERRVDENMKITCGKKWNSAINDVKYKVCTELKQLYNNE